MSVSGISGGRAAAFLSGLALCAACSGEPPSPGGWLVEIGEQVGLDFVHDTGAAGRLHLREIMSSGAAMADLDGDGSLDLYLVNGGGPNRLYLQRGGRFVDATPGSGLDDAGYGLGVGVGDVDNDGDLDVYVANDGPDRLFRNRGGARFDDATPAVGPAGDGFSSSVALCDYDRDGFLDIYVGRYVEYDPSRTCRDSTGRPDYCSPLAFKPARDVLLHNEAGATFRDASAAAGIDTVAAAALGVVCEDLDGDGWPDFYVANDQYANQLWINRGDGTFVDRAMLHGAAYNLEGRAEAGMGVVAADLDGDADLDLYLTHLETESNTLYRNLGSGLFEDATAPAGLAQDSYRFTGFGTVAVDVELDGDLDLFVANGRVLRAPGAATAPGEPWWRAYAEPNLFYVNDGAGRFTLRQDLGRAFTEPVEVSRALAAGDIDDDGDLDLLVTGAQSPARLYRNDAPRRGSWLAVRAFDPRLARDAIGARVIVAAAGRQWLRTVASGSSYLSSAPARAHFGLGAVERVDWIEVRWPDGLAERFHALDTGRSWTLERGTGEAAP